MLDKVSVSIRYILLMVNALLTLIPIYYGLDTIVFIIWSWSIWLIICYELMDTCNKIYHFTLKSSEKKILFIGIFIQGIYVGCYYLFIYGQYNKKILVCSLIIMQLIKMVIYINTIDVLEREKLDFKETYYTIDQLSMLFKLYILHKEKRTSIKEENPEAIYIFKMVIAIIWVYGGFIVTSIGIFFLDKILFTVFLLSIYIVGTFYCVYLLYDFANMTYKSYLSVVMGIILSFIVFNGFVLGDFFDGWFKIYYVTLFQMPFLFAIKLVVDKVGGLRE